MTFVRVFFFFFFSSRRRHTRFDCDWSSDVYSSDVLFRSALRYSWRMKGVGAACDASSAFQAWASSCCTLSSTRVIIAVSAMPFLAGRCDARCRLSLWGGLVGPVGSIAFHDALHLHCPAQLCRGRPARQCPENHCRSP